MLDGLGISVISTSQGVMSDRQARGATAGRRVAVHGVVGRGESMSRIGKQPVAIPAGVKVKVADGKVLVEGPEGQKLELPYHRHIKVEVDEAGKVIKVTRPDDERHDRGRCTA